MNKIHNPLTQKTYTVNTAQSPSGDNAAGESPSFEDLPKSKLRPKSIALICAAVAALYAADAFLSGDSDSGGSSLALFSGNDSDDGDSASSVREPSWFARHFCRGIRRSQFCD